MTTLLVAVTKKRRNLHRIDRAYSVQQHRKALTDEVLRIYDAEVKAALKAERMAR